MDLLQNCKIKYNEETKIMVNKNDDEIVELNNEDLDNYDKYRQTHSTTSLSRQTYATNDSIAKSNEVFESRVVSPPPNIWEIYPFGKNVKLIISLPDEISLWRRIMFKLFFGVHFERI